MEGRAGRQDGGRAMTGLAAIAGRLAQLIRLLGSDKDGEVVAAARAIGRVLESAGRHWHDLAEAVEAAGEARVIRYAAPRRPPPPALAEWQRLAMCCLRQAGGRLTAGELDFLRSMAHLPHEPSARQWRWLDAIALSLRCGAEPA